MATEIRVVGQKFYSKLKNGNTYTEETSDFSQHLKGGVLEEIKAVFNVQVGWYLEISGGTAVLYVDNVAGTVRLQISGKNFSNEGFSIGDTYKYSDPGVAPDSGFAFTGTILSISDGEMLMTYENLTGALNAGYSRPLETNFITGTTLKTALKYDFGLIENDEAINFLSKLTRTTQTYLFQGINHATPNVFVDGVTQGNNKAAYTGSSKVAFVGYSIDKDEINPSNTTQEFQIEHTFKINPVYKDGELDALKGLDIPPLRFNGDSSLKYVFQTEFRTVLSNPNTSMVSEYDSQIGSVGYIGESYNGFANNYSLSSLAYSVGGVSADKLEVGGVTSVSFNVSAPQSTFTPSTPFIVGHTAIVDSTSYAFNADVYDDVWTDETLRTVTGASSVDGTLIKNLVVSYNNTGSLSVSFDVEFTSAQKARLSDGQDYMLYYTVQNPSLTTDEGDKVTDKIDINYYFKNNDVAGLFDFETLTQYPHPLDSTEVGFTNALTFNESGMMANGVFWVLNDATLNDLKFDIAVYKFSDDTWDSLRSLVIDLSDQTTVNGIQRIELDTTRGYILEDDSIFNYLKITTGSNDGTKQFYSIQVGYRIPWQSWLEFKDAPVDFYDTSKSYNGLNQKASNYSMSGSGNNVFADAIGGTFENTNTATWNLTTQGYTPSFPNQVGGGFTSAAFGYLSDFSGYFGWSAPNMNQVNDIYSIFDNNTTIDVVEGEYYEIISYIAMKGGFEPSHLDNGLFYWLPTGSSMYTKAECENIKGFFITLDKLYSGTEPIDSDWRQIKTYFKAKATETLSFTFVEELTKSKINSSTGGNFSLDGISVKKVEYGIKTLFDATIDSTRYVKTSEEIKVYDYDKDDKDPTDFLASIKTYNIDDTEIANNVIKDGYTQVRAIFTPIVPPVFSSSVDFTHADELYNPNTGLGWNRFAHGNKYLISVFRRDPTWANEQASDNDFFYGYIPGQQGPTFTKNDLGLYTTDPTSIYANDNCGAFYGIYSEEKYDGYVCDGTMYADESVYPSTNDNDAIAYNIAFHVDEDGVEHTLSLIASSGGISMEVNPDYVSGNTATNIFYHPSDSTKARVALVYNYGKDGQTVLEQIEFQATKSFYWAEAGDLFYSVTRSDTSIISTSTTWDMGGNGLNQFDTNFEFDLESNPLTEKFLGAQAIGFSFYSQNDGGFKDVVITQASNDYYTEIRVEPKDAQSDFTSTRISSHLEAPQGNLLTQISGDIPKASLSWDGSSFIGQCLVDTTQIEQGEDYVFSAELRPLDLEE